MTDEDEETWENEGGAGVREPMKPKPKPNEGGAVVEPEPASVGKMSWYY